MYESKIIILLKWPKKSLLYDRNIWINVSYLWEKLYIKLKKKSCNLLRKTFLKKFHFVKNEKMQKRLILKFMLTTNNNT